MCRIADQPSLHYLTPMVCAVSHLPTLRLRCSSESKNALGGLFRVAYGLRSYSPELGRWINRDPIGIVGGYHEYCFIENGTMQNYDFNGLATKPLVIDLKKSISAQLSKRKDAMEEIRKLAFGIPYVTQADFYRMIGKSLRYTRDNYTESSFTFYRDEARIVKGRTPPDGIARGNTHKNLGDIEGLISKSIDSTTRAEDRRLSAEYMTLSEELNKGVTSERRREIDREIRRIEKSLAKHDYDWLRVYRYINQWSGKNIGVDFDKKVVGVYHSHPPQTSRQMEKLTIESYASGSRNRDDADVGKLRYIHDRNKQPAVKIRDTLIISYNADGSTDAIAYNSGPLAGHLLNYAIDGIGRPDGYILSDGTGNLADVSYGYDPDTDSGLLTVVKLGTG